MLLLAVAGDEFEPLLLLELEFVSLDLLLLLFDDFFPFPLTLERNIWVFSPLVPSKQEKNILVLLKNFAQFVYFLREMCLFFNF